jgi:crossover junction endodeoxyribonuclease RuvC
VIPEDLVPPDCPYPIVLGIDPGTRHTGWGALLLVPQTPRFVACGVLDLPARASVAVRLGKLLEELEQMLSRLRPGWVALEGAFSARNVQSALRIGEARGVVLGAAARRGIRIREISPAAAKKAVIGHGGASKEQVARMMARLLGIELEGMADDATDALALAWSVAQRLRFEERVSTGI